MRLLFLTIILFVVAVFTVGCSVFGIRSEEEPPYEIVLLDVPFEVRAYKSYVVAETESTGNYDEATDTSFQRLFKYISGNNVEQKKLPMTAPVEVRDSSQELQMSAPVLIEGNFKGRAWKMSFVLPAGVTLRNAPIPKDDLVHLREIPAKKVAVHTFSGTLSEKKAEPKIRDLKIWMKENNLSPLSEPTLAGYDPPWTLPFLRRNEVQIQVR